MSREFGFDPIPGAPSEPPEAEPALGPPVELTPETAALRVIGGPGAGGIFRLESVRGVIGRSDPPAIAVDIDLTECERDAIPVVSRRHAEWEWAGAMLRIVDLGSTNGTWINGGRLASESPGGPSTPAPLRLGDRVTLANVTVEVVTHG